MADGRGQSNRAAFGAAVEEGKELALTCRSVRSRLAAISILLGRHKYLLKWNSFSSSSSCVFVYAVRRRRGRPFSGTNSAAIENCIFWFESVGKCEFERGSTWIAERLLLANCKRFDLAYKFGA